MIDSLSQEQAKPLEKGKKNNTTKQKQTNKETPTKPIASSFFVRAF